jgi:hypothetical protein
MKVNVLDNAASRAILKIVSQTAFSIKFFTAPTDYRGCSISDLVSHVTNGYRPSANDHPPVFI